MQIRNNKVDICGESDLHKGTFGIQEPSTSCVYIYKISLTQLIGRKLDKRRLKDCLVRHYTAPHPKQEVHVLKRGSRLKTEQEFVQEET